MAVESPQDQLKCRLVAMTRKNDEYSKMIQRLMKTVEQEKIIHERRIHDLMRESDAQLRHVQMQCREEKMELIARNVEIEKELKAVLDKSNEKNNNENAKRIVKSLEMRLIKVSAELKTRTNDLLVN